ncbi:MAG: SDR family oxidoreductase [Proteobacteria bacterium]|nr:SDR family oxidoreductase [Pseudomonadota bacterium]
MNIIITGASRGIGFETVKLFAKTEGNKIFAVSRNKQKIEDLAKTCKIDQPYSTVIPLAFDLSDKKELNSLVNEINREVSHIDILINNAGFLVSRNFDEILDTEIEQIFNVNVLAPMFLIQKILPLLKKSEKAHVVNISSMAGFQGSSKFPGLVPYSASKSAIAGLTECLAEEYKDTNIRFNALALGAVSTEMLAEAFPGYDASTSAIEMANYFYDFALNGHKMFNGKVLPVSSTTP